MSSKKPASKKSTTKLTTKVLCLSVLVFPGAGHFYLKCYVRGILFFIVVIAALLFIMTGLFDIALAIAKDIESGNIQLDVLAIRELIYSSLLDNDKPAFSIAKWAIVVAWVLSIIDAFRVAYFREHIEETKELSG